MFRFDLYDHYDQNLFIVISTVLYVNSRISTFKLQKIDESKIRFIFRVKTRFHLGFAFLLFALAFILSFVFFSLLRNHLYYRKLTWTESVKYWFEIFSMTYVKHIVIEQNILTLSVLLSMFVFLIVVRWKRRSRVNNISLYIKRKSSLISYYT